MKTKKAKMFAFWTDAPRPETPPRPKQADAMSPKPETSYVPTFVSLGEDVVYSTTKVNF
jgi:hypothetical protein